MTSFAATGWVEEDGTWVYYNRDEERATEEWKKSGDNWFWLDDNGEMAVDQLIEDDDDYYYVNEAGAMVSNQWVAIENEDAGEEDEPDAYWYYFQTSGKEVKAEEGKELKTKTINGRKYGFDEQGRMIDGLVFLGMASKGEEGNRYSTKEIDAKYADDSDTTGRYDTEDDFDAFVNRYAKEIGDHAVNCYYFGDGDGGAMKTGKQTVEIDGENFTFKFKDSSSLKGVGITGLDDDKLYMAGKLVEANSDDKYKAVAYLETSDGAIYMGKVDNADVIDFFVTNPEGDPVDANKDDSDIKYVIKDSAELKTAVQKWFADEKDVVISDTVKEVKLYLVNTSGSVVKSKTSAKDGEGYKFKATNKSVTEIIEEN